MIRILTFHDPNQQGDGRLGAAYYLSQDCTPISVRIHAEDAPSIGDATFDIFADGVSIFESRGRIIRDTSSVITSNESHTEIFLGKGQDTEEAAEDFAVELIGGWVTCEMVSNGAGKNFTVQLEVEVHEDEDEVDD